MTPPSPDAHDDGTGTIEQDQKTEKSFNMERLRASLLASRELEVVEIEIDDDDDEYDEVEDDGQENTRAGKFFLPKIPPFRGGNRKSSIATAASEDTFEEIIDDIDEDEIEEEVIEDDEEEIIEEVVGDDEYIEVVEEEDPATPSSPVASPKKTPPDSSKKSPEQKDSPVTGDTEDDDNDGGEEEDEGDKPDAEEVREAIRYILRQEKAVENGHISPEQAEQMLALPLSDMMDIMNHFELCDNNSAPIRWDLVLLMVFSQDEDAVDPDDDDDEDADAGKGQVAVEDEGEYLEVEVDEHHERQRGVRRTISG